jgi:hypothetical protein
MPPTQRVIQQGACPSRTAENAVKQKGSELRWAKRRERNTPAHIVLNSEIFGTRAAPIPCILKDTSSTGARIELARSTAERWLSSSGSGITESFRLRIPSEHIEVECRVAWTEETMMGVQFTAPARVMKRQARPRREPPAPKSKLPGLGRLFST